MNTPLHSIQYLRAVAALMIVLVHAPLQLERMGYSGHWPNWLNMGVDIFFVISGFIMWITTDGTAMMPLQFLMKRIARIVPLYWLLTAVTVIVLAAAPSLLQSGAFNVEHILKSFLFIAAKHPVTHEMQPVLVPGWTLNLEMFFYVLFALGLVVSGALRAGVIIVAIAAIVACQAFFPDRVSLGGFYTSGILLEFAYGIALGMAFKRWVNLPGTRPLVYAGFGCTVIGIVLVASDLPRAVGFGVPSLLLVGAGLVAERKGWIGLNKPLHAIGDASYSLYLTHGIVLSIVGQAWRKIGAASLPLNGVLFTSVAVAACVICAIAVYRWVERPIQAMLREGGRGRGVASPNRA